MAGQRSRHRYRCNQCRRGGHHGCFTLRRGAKRIQRPRCKSKDDIYDIEAGYQRAQLKRLKKNPRCYCSPVPFPHRKGSHAWCTSHPNADRPLTRDEEQHMQEVWENPRRTSCA